ncbi:TetR/AcrR family transcriptional regulator [Paenibacillus beijingensis]|uniref:TetR family transcriptional regulator n=1 Tax=Paenibacillus beijingensis TaxID=1126833 RepID=A0A0D5NL70_9BACL|nr:TetR family transcriptional regulator C-terminal domain-containing protein [Paenibacillus beijingensis]AJY75653.1 TetR family transcriptional regulator [Paenibacillus beijingensis]
MPKIVNHQKRKEQLAEAAWRVIRREGLEGLSVRRVADEAGMSLGSLRHYFDTHAELLAFSMRLVSQRVNERIEQLPFTGDARRDIEMIIAQLLPLDEQRLAEAELWLAFAGKAISDPAIRKMSLEMHDELYNGFRRMIDSLILNKLAKDGIDAEQETKELHALVDGLAVHRATFPERVREDDLMRIVSHHLNRLFKN